MKKLYKSDVIIVIGELTQPGTRPCETISGNGRIKHGNSPAFVRLGRFLTMNLSVRSAAESLDWMSCGSRTTRFMRTLQAVTRA